MDLFMLRDARAKGDISLCRHAWLGKCIRSEFDFLIGFKAGDRYRWYFLIDNMSVSAVTVVPAIISDIGNSSFALPDLTSVPVFLLISSLKFPDVACWSYVWKSWTLQ